MFFETEASKRKSRSEALLRRQSVPINPDLPPIESADEIELKSGEEVMRRAMCLFAVSQAAITGNVSGSNVLLERWKLMEDLTPAEQLLLTAGSMSEGPRVQLSWRCEALIPLMWATGLIDEMPFPTEPFDFAYLSEFWMTAPSGYWVDVGTRPANQILDQADLIYRFHWAVRDATLQGKTSPAGLNPGVIVERHHALNWMIGYGDHAEWDDVTTDT